MLSPPDRADCAAEWPDGPLEKLSRQRIADRQYRDTRFKKKNGEEIRRKLGIGGRGRIRETFPVEAREGGHKTSSPLPCVPRRTFVPPKVLPVSVQNRPSRRAHPVSKPRCGFGDAVGRRTPCRAATRRGAKGVWARFNQHDRRRRRRQRLRFLAEARS